MTSNINVFFFIILILFVKNSFGNIPKEELYCLADNIYFEARGETTIGKFAVLKVTLNRVKDNRFPNTICNVVKQKVKRKSGKIGCEFSWYCDGISDEPKEKGEYKKIVDFVKSLWYSMWIMDDPTKGAVFYHSTIIKGTWFKRNKTKTTKIGDHIFYK